MANLKPAHAAAIARLRTYVPPPTQYYSLPLTRRAAVLILLFADRKGELRVVLTMRAKTLSSYAGQAALPGGKADALSESPFQTARREAYEEIGLPLSDANFPPPFRIEELCQMPMNLAKTELGVRPCIAYISPHPNYQPKDGTPIPSAEEVLLPRLDAREVAAVFSAPFHNFLREEYEDSSSLVDGSGTAVETAAETAPSPSGHSQGSQSKGERPPKWYTGSWTDWHESRWRMHNFYVPRAGQVVTWSSPKNSSSAPGHLPYRDIPRTSPLQNPPAPPMSASPSDLSSTSSSSSSAAAAAAAAAAAVAAKTFRVFGMTARILVDAAREAYAEQPEFEHNSHFGDEEMIERLVKMGRLGPVRRPGEELTRKDLEAASKI